MFAVQIVLGSLRRRKLGAHRVVLRRANGRFVKDKIMPSKYAAKRLRDIWEAKYDTSYYVEIRPIE